MDVSLTKEAAEEFSDLSKPLTVFVAYATHRDFDDIFVCDSPETAREVCEGHFPEYFGQAFVWHEPKRSKNGMYTQTGSFTYAPYERVPVVIYEQKIFTRGKVA